SNTSMRPERALWRFVPSVVAVDKHRKICRCASQHECPTSEMGQGTLGGCLLYPRKPARTVLFFQHLATSWIQLFRMTDTYFSAYSTADERLLMCDSYSRAEKLVREMYFEPSPREQIALFLQWGNICDAPWAYRGNYASILREAVAQVPLVDVLEKPDREWFDSLPDEISIYRGCTKGLERGLHWSTDIEVAKGFAIGKRCINPQPRLVSARIPKRHVLGVFTNRSESEIAVDPRRLRQLRIREVGDGDMSNLQIGGRGN